MMTIAFLLLLAAIAWLISIVVGILWEATFRDPGDDDGK